MNQSLVDDFLVSSDKIGSANFFWSFPSKALVDKTNMKEEKERAIVHNKEAYKRLIDLLSSLPFHDNEFRLHWYAFPFHAFISHIHWIISS